MEGAVTAEILKAQLLLTVGEENNWYEFYHQEKRVAYVAKGDVEDANIDIDPALDDENEKNIEEQTAHILSHWKRRSEKLLR